MEEQKKHLDKTIEDWKDGGEQVDDILIFGIRVRFYYIYSHL